MPAPALRRAVITGMGCVCAAGFGPDAALAAMSSPPPLTPGSQLGQHALPYPFYAVDDAFFTHEGQPHGRRISALDTLALARHVARAALDEAALPPTALTGMAVFMGTTAGSALHFLRHYSSSRDKDAAFAPPLPHSMARPMAGAAVSDKDDFLAANLALNLVPESRGLRLTLANACTSGSDAVGLALAAIEQGADCALCGGADALSIVPHTGFARLMIYADTACRPFDRQRKGLNLGEGAAVLVLEEENHARARGAVILGRVLGYGAAADAHHFTAPHPQARGLVKAVTQALAHAGMQPQELAFINAHATATPENDKVEGNALRLLAPGVPVWAGKGATGHTLGAAGALEAVLTVQALRRGLVPPSPGFAEEDPAIGLTPTTCPLPLRGDVALSTSLGFGGGNAALLLQGERA